MILPFFIIKLQGFKITLESYLQFLKLSFSKHTLGQLFNNNFSEIPMEKKLYMIISIGFYFYQIYQNVNSCIKFHQNMKNIHHYLFKLKDYIYQTCNSMSNLFTYTSSLNTYSIFNKDLLYNRDFLLAFYEKLKKITQYNFSISKLFQIGYILKLFYVLHDDTQYMKCLSYSFGFNGFIENLQGLKNNIKTGYINFSKHSNKCKFTDAYFPTLKDDKPVKNSYQLNKHLIITGPNAAGKTTLLKTSLINIILNQQIACGFYKTASLKLYDSIHCYINIPDTSSRDSLFQAEARRCKEILDKIDNISMKKNHFCVFDELYSGTNPYEAIGSAYSLINYLNSYNNINFILTTHYIDLCEKLDKTKNIQNYHMKIIEDKNTDKFTYTYKLHKGISYIKGGTRVLHELKYPDKIVDSVIDVIKDLKI